MQESNGDAHDVECIDERLTSHLGIASFREWLMLLPPLIDLSNESGHVLDGDVRTVLFNWLYARQHCGQFLLRIDDADAGRNVAEALLPISTASSGSASIGMKGRPTT